MTGTLLMTGANGSLGVHVVGNLLTKYPALTLVLAVRDDSDKDSSTVELRKIVSRYSDANVSIRKLDLGSLEEVRVFSTNLQSEIIDGKLPRIVALLCNAMIWKLSGGPVFTEDGYETAMAINHLAHFEMVLRLLNALDTQRGRIIFFGSEAHWPERSGLPKDFLTKPLKDVERLVHPPQEATGTVEGFRRYGLSKLVITMVAYELNRRLAENKATELIHAITIDPGNMVNSTTFSRAHLPWAVKMMFKIAALLKPLLVMLGQRLTSVEQAAEPVTEVAVADQFAGQEGPSGYFESGVKVASSPDSLDQEMQRKLWDQSVVWCGLKSSDTMIRL